MGPVRDPGQILALIYASISHLICIFARLGSLTVVLVILIDIPAAQALQQKSPELQLPAAPLAPAPDQPAAPAGQGLDHKGRPIWRELQPGLEFCELRPQESDTKIAVLRIDPRYFDFELASASRTNEKSRSLAQWATEKNFAAAINASMYLPDNRTSTGYMRSGDYVNNGRIMDRFGAFFAADPKKPGLPNATIIDRDDPDWRKKLDDYDTVIQNYRMVNSKRRILWYPGGPIYSISAIALDGVGRILFLHSRMPVEAYSFVQELLHLPLDVRTVMYVEGGAQAGLVVDAGGLKRDLSGPHAPSLLITGNLKAVLPNVIGIVPKKAVEFHGVANPVN